MNDKKQKLNKGNKENLIRIGMNCWVSTNSSDKRNGGK